MYMLSQQQMPGNGKAKYPKPCYLKGLEKSTKGQTQIVPKNILQEVDTTQSLPLFAASTQGRTCTTFCHISCCAYFTVYHSHIATSQTEPSSK
jgi:hypothetical protein